MDKHLVPFKKGPKSNGGNILMQIMWIMLGTGSTQPREDNWVGT